MHLTLASGQLACRLFDPAANLEAAARLIWQAVQRGAKLILLPEFLPTGCVYDEQLPRFAEPIGGPTTQWLSDWSERTGCWIGCGMIEADGERTFDTFVLTGPNGDVHSYRKRYPAFFENLYFCRGNTAGLFETPLGRIGVMICWDLVHARLVRELAGRIDLLLICAAWPDLTTGSIPLPGLERWFLRQVRKGPPRLARILNVPVVFSNLTGPFVTPVPGLGLTYRADFAGKSAVYDRDGRCLSGLHARPGLAVATVTAAVDAPVQLAPARLMRR